jgi:hypothetical protein
MTVATVEEIRRLPGTWDSSDYRRLLEALEVEDLDEYSNEDLESVALMALQDAGPDDAANIVLSSSTEGQFSSGQIRNLCEELKEDRAWEEYADLARQELLYVCVDLLHAAFPFDYPEPSATRVVLELRADGLDKVLARHPLDAATLIRGVSQALGQDSILNRFFSDRMVSGDFPEAASVLWHMEEAPIDVDTRSVTFVGSSYWFQDLEEGESSCTLRWNED